MPGSSPQFFEKAARSAADVVFLDLEDAVAPDQKVQARKNIVQALHEIDWGDKTLTVRINGLDTQYMYRDVIDVIEQGSERLDLIMIPKVGTAADVYALDMLVTQCEPAMGWQEAARLLADHRDRARHGQRRRDRRRQPAQRGAAFRGRRLRRLDPRAHHQHRRAQSRLRGADRPGRGRAREVHWGDMWHYALARMVVAARAHGLRPIDGPFGDFSDADGYRAAARRAAALGCEGKWAIHPSQIALANEVMSPPAAEVDKARRILEAMAQARAEGKGAVSLDGRLIDIASIRQAEALVAKAEQIAAKRG